MDVNQFWDALNALSEELLWSAEDKLRLKTEGKTLEIRIDETFANARFVRDILKALIRENRFTILPLTVQKLFADIVRQISETLTAGADDQDTIESLTQHVESAITLVWQYHLQSIPDDYLDYARKQESLKRVEEEFATARGAMVSALTTASSLGEAFARSKENEDALKLLLVSGNESVGKILEDVSKSTTVTADAESVLKKIKDANTEAGDFRSKADTAASDAKSANDSIQAFFKEISTYRIEMTAATAESRSAISEGKKAVKTFLETSSQTANDTIKEFNDNTEAAKVTRQTELDKLDTRMASKEANIDKQLLKAIGKSMFHSFDTRKKQIWVTKWIWVGIVIVLFGVSACYAYLLSSWLYTEKIVTILPAVYLRFSIALPLAGAIWFAIAQYAKERRYEEEYAFRSNISVSLVPYRDEVAKLLAVEQTEENTKLADFVIRSIDRVYTMPSELNQKPTDRIEDMVSRFADLPKEILDKLPEILKAINPKGKV